MDGDYRIHYERLRLSILSAAVIAMLLLVGTACRNVGETGSATGAATTTSVEVHETGGLAGVDVLYTVDGAVDLQRRTELFDTVGSERFLALHDSYTAPNGCRDGYSHTVTATYSDGRRKQITADECGQAPPMLTNVITLTKELGHRRVPE
ncbi:hypothetical protein [Nocardia brasiliensis]|uniref:hypothetical protein n=1 Tax=Nocardia brasiliensis TaxID=37326 RepID=UPI00245655F1|nr:hypothetical protein [Nocardia brasiliensis]